MTSYVNIAKLCDHVCLFNLDVFFMLIVWEHYFFKLKRNMKPIRFDITVLESEAKGSEDQISLLVYFSNNLANGQHSG